MPTLSCDHRRRWSHRHKMTFFYVRLPKQSNTVFTWFSIRFYVFLCQIGELYDLPNIDTTCHHRKAFIRKIYSDAGKNKSLCHWCHTVANDILSLRTCVQNNTHTPMPGVTDIILTMCRFLLKSLSYHWCLFWLQRVPTSIGQHHQHHCTGIGTFSCWVACSQHAVTVQPA